jgi:hypothetical protein
MLAEWRRSAHGSRKSDRGCPLGTGLVHPIWYAGGTADEASDLGSMGVGRGPSTSLLNLVEDVDVGQVRGLDGLQLSAVRIVVAILRLGLDGRIRAANDAHRNTRL